MTYQEAAKNALQCQDACNLSGVVFSFAKAMQAICDESNSKEHFRGTDWKNKHAIVAMFLDKLIDLNGRDRNLANDITECENIAGIKAYDL